MAGGIFETFLNLLYPREPVPENLPTLEYPMCERCGEPFSAAGDPTFSCTNCGKRKWHLELARAGYRSEGFVRESIHRFKYEQQFHLKPLLGDWLLEGYVRFFAGWPWDGLVPVPLHPSRRRERGFNQASELTGWLSTRSGIARRDVLRRVEVTPPQARLSRNERLENVRQAFALKGEPDLQGLHLLIIDDVFTTGATINACAQVLKRGGAERVCALTVARG